MGYDEVIPLLGDFGRYQKRIYFLLCLPAIVCAFHKLGNVFLIAEPSYRCTLPGELPNNSYSLSTEQLEKWYPWDELQKKYSQCSYIEENGEEKRCTDYIYDENLYGRTIVVEWTLTCDRAHVIATGNAIFMFGVMLGSIIFGELSDRYGRKLIFFISLVMQVIFGGLAAFAPEFWSFTISRMVVGATTSGVFLVAYVIALEMVGPTKRLIAGTICQMFFSTGYMLTAVVAIYFQEWRTMQLALTLPGLVFLSYWWIIPESSRWLISKDRIPEAKKLIQAAAAVNKVTISDERLNELLVNEEKKNEPEKQSSVLDIFKYPNLRKRAFIIFFDWFANNITYYGLSWSTNNLGGNPYLNFVISGAVEIPAYTFLIVTLNRWGRKLIMCGCMIVAGLSLLLTMAVPHGMNWLEVTLAMIGKLAITSSYGAVYLFSTEQFPTVIRNAGLGAGSTCARLGSVLAPYINLTNKVWGPLPLIIFGVLSLIGGVLSLTLPETLNRKLPETFEEGEAFGRSKKKANNDIEQRNLNSPKAPLAQTETEDGDLDKLDEEKVEVKIEDESSSKLLNGAT